MVPPVARMVMFDFCWAKTAVLTIPSRNSRDKHLNSDFIANSFSLCWLAIVFLAVLRRLVLGLVKVGELYRVEQVLDLCLGKYLFVPDHFQDALPALVSLLRELRGFLIAEHRIECRHN